MDMKPAGMWQKAFLDFVRDKSADSSLTIPLSTKTSRSFILRQPSEKINKDKLGVDKPADNQSYKIYNFQAMYTRRWQVPACLSAVPFRFYCTVSEFAALA